MFAPLKYFDLDQEFKCALHLTDNTKKCFQVSTVKIGVLDLFSSYNVLYRTLLNILAHSQPSFLESRRNSSSVSAQPLLSNLYLSTIKHYGHSDLSMQLTLGSSMTGVLKTLQRIIN